MIQSTLEERMKRINFHLNINIYYVLLPLYSPILLVAYDVDNCIHKDEDRTELTYDPRMVVVYCLNEEVMNVYAAITDRSGQWKELHVSNRRKSKFRNKQKNQANLRGKYPPAMQSLRFASA